MVCMKPILSTREHVLTPTSCVYAIVETYLILHAIRVWLRRLVLHSDVQGAQIKPRSVRISGHQHGIHTM